MVFFSMQWIVRLRLWKSRNLCTAMGNILLASLFYLSPGLKFDIQHSPPLLVFAGARNGSLAPTMAILTKWAILPTPLMIASEPKASGGFVGSFLIDTAWESVLATFFFFFFLLHSTSIQIIFGETEILNEVCILL